VFARLYISGKAEALEEATAIANTKSDVFINGASVASPNILAPTAFGQI
jgi:hypothetical protein